jgi:hypothetical protein
MSNNYKNISSLPVFDSLKIVSDIPSPKNPNYQNFNASVQADRCHKFFIKTVNSAVAPTGF